MPKLTLNDFANQFVITGGVREGVTYNEMDDLVPVTYMGHTMKIDFGTDDSLVGTGAEDRITVNNGNDTVHARAGNDIVVDLGSGNDSFYGEGGNDTFDLGAGNDYVDGGAGKDTLDYRGIDFMVIADLKQGFIFAEGLDQVANVENIMGSEWNDTLMGDAGNNVFWGMGGNDKLRGGGGRDALYGGAGEDTITGAGSLLGGEGNDVVTSTARRRGDQGDTLYGEGGNDRMTGNNGDDKMYGGLGDDVMKGGIGQDVLHGGSGINTLTGGLDRDVFAFQNFGADHMYDKITDFEVAYDKIDLRQIDADPFTDGKQSFEFDNRANRYDDDVLSNIGGDAINGGIGKVSTHIDDGYTYIYVQTRDGLQVADIRLDGEHTLTASNFFL